MKRNDFKSVVSDFLKGMMEQWFPDKGFIKGLGWSLIDANVNKFDNLLQLFEDENGEIDAVGLIKNMNIEEPIKIDLQQYSPILPHRVLLITKDDINDLLNHVSEKQDG